jgi:hypothetical protein
MRPIQGLSAVASLRQSSSINAHKLNKGKIMKRLRIPLAATILVLALSVPAFAGDMWAGITSQPPSQPTASATGDIQCGVAPTSETTNSETITVDPVAGSMLQLMVSVLSLF